MISTQSGCGTIPFQTTKPITTTAFVPKVIAAVSVADIGITERGKTSLRSSDSRDDERPHRRVMSRRRRR